MAMIERMGAMAYLKVGIKELEPLLDGNVQKWNAYKYSIPYKVELIVDGLSFENLTLDHPDLNLVCFRDCTFKDCVIEHSNLNYSFFDACYFYHTKLVDCHIDDAKLNKCFFQECSIAKSTLINTEIYQTSLDGLVGDGTEFKGTFLIGTDLPIQFKLSNIEERIAACNNLLLNKDPSDDRTTKS